MNESRSLTFDPDEAGVLIDALIEHRASAEARKATNTASTSDVRATICVQLIQRIRDHYATQNVCRIHGWPANACPPCDADANGSL